MKQSQQEQGWLDESRAAAEVFFGIFKVVLIASAAYNCLEWMKPQSKRYDMQRSQ